jgi:hypothetical protein
MFKNRRLIVIVGAILLLGGLIAIRSFAGVKNDGLLYAGMGDLHRYEAGQTTLNTEAPQSARTYIGAVDLHRLAERINSRQVGMGDLHRFEGEQTILYTGMGGLHRLEAGQSIP